MSDLREFLTARLDEEALLAHRAAAFRDAFDDEGSDDGVDWVSDTTMVYTTGQVYLVSAIPPENFGRPGPEEMLKHIAHWDPARVLAEVEAKRSLIELSGALLGVDLALKLESDDILLSLAQPYSDHPGFDPAWRT